MKETKLENLKGYELVKKGLSEFEQYTKAVETRMKICDGKLNNLHELEIDIMHEIELDRLSATQMTFKYKELQGVRRLRRKYKDEREYISIFNTKFNIGRLTDTLRLNEKKKKEHDNRTYNHRIKKNVRKELNDEIKKAENEREG